MTLEQNNKTSQVGAENICVLLHKSTLYSFVYCKDGYIMAGGARIVFKLLMLLAFIGWIIVWIMAPTATFGNHFWTPVLNHVSIKAYGETGVYTLIYTAPILFMAFISALYLSYIKKTSRSNSGRMKMLEVNPWTYPVFVRGPLALVSAAELVLLVASTALYIWTFAKYMKSSFDRINVPFDWMGMPITLGPLWERKFNIVGDILGVAGAVPFAFLFFPVARLSSLFQLLHIPFEHAVRYHIWTGHITMFLWSAHSIVYVLYWPIAHKSREFIEWHKTDISGLTGVLVWIVGLAMWGTSLNPVRKHKFELFYYTHQLYLLFIVGFVLHLGERWLASVIAGIFLFFIDRLFRFLQSRRHVEVVSARFISPESLELTFAKLPNLHYPAASVIFLNLPAISHLQWHPFTVITCSSVDTDRISVIVKCSGRWTQKLKDLLLQENSKASKDYPAHFEAAIEGPHGHELEYLHAYTRLVFVAGGSGVAPFVSILKDLLYKVQNRERHPPNRIVLILAVKTSEELDILRSISPASICPEFAIDLDVQAYVTRENGIDLEENKSSAATKEKCVNMCFAGRASLAEHKKAVRAVAKTHGYKLYAATILTSFAGYMLLAGLVHRFYIYPKDHNTYQVCSRSGRGFVSLLEYLLSICVFGGGTILIWTWWKGKEDYWNLVEAPLLKPMLTEGGLEPSRVQYGKRPLFQEIFVEYAKSKEHTGVFVCGPEGMQESVGLECQANKKLNFHPLNFEL